MGLTDADRSALAELTPLLRRVAGLDPRIVARLQIRERAATAWVWLPFGVLASRRVRTTEREPALDVTVRAAEAAAWLDPAADDAAADNATAEAQGGVGSRPGDAPTAVDAEWRWALPPDAGWRHVEEVPDTVVRPLVRSGALTLKEAAQREGVPGAQPRAEVADALLDTAVLTVSDETESAEVTLRALSALTRLGFLPRGGSVRVDVAGRWIRVAGGYGSVYLERASGLRLA